MSADEPLGTVLREEGRVALRYERHLRHPPEKVWRALTESEHLAAWLPCDIEGDRRAGAAIVLRFWPALQAKYGITTTPTLTGAIRTWDPPRVFEWTWDADLLRFELHPEPGGTRLVFTTWLGASDVHPSDTAAGWHVCLDNLGLLLDTGAAPGAAGVDPEPVKGRYAALLGE